MKSLIFFSENLHYHRYFNTKECKINRSHLDIQHYKYTGLFEIIFGVLTTCHTQYTWDSSICIFLFNGTTLQVFVTYLTGALYVHHLWFYKHQHDNRVRPKLFVACQRWWFQWRFWFVPSVPGYLREEEEHKPDPWRDPIEGNHMGLHLENEVAGVITPKSFRITLYIRSFRYENKDTTLNAMLKFC